MEGGTRKLLGLEILVSALKLGHNSEAVKKLP